MTSMRQVRLNQHSRTRDPQSGFTLIEVLMAIVILLVGIVAVAQLVPASISSNSINRNDSAALVFAQREMDQFLRQPLNMSFSPPSFIDAEGNSCDLGDPAQSNTVVGSPTLVNYDQVIIDFTASPVAGYSFTYQDPNDPAGVVYDVRWAVITVANSGMVSSKRFILGARRKGGNGIYKPVTLDTILER
ncbi:MAG TPA: prepilin-type N-terminal cleavage/methylation domain-containing protein [Candidatus Acidoferrum sp.]|nr:prepilin-type N-terminal cleavage/methylation domain-containing protein [Candidatus Acidoferrum sp.]